MTEQKQDFVAAADKLAHWAPRVHALCELDRAFNGPREVEVILRMTPPGPMGHLSAVRIGGYLERLFQTLPVAKQLHEREGEYARAYDRLVNDLPDYVAELLTKNGGVEMGALQVKWLQESVVEWCLGRTKELPKQPPGDSE